MKLSVSILSVKDNYNLWLDKLSKTDVEYLHLDVMDSTFTKYSSFNIKESKEIRNLWNKKLDVHIMSTDLDNILEEYIKLKPEIISIHYEAVKDLNKYIKLIKDNNIKVGIAINPETSINRICGYLNDIDQILVMSVTPGLGGQKFKKEVINKLKLLKELQKDYKFDIELDGGVNNDIVNKVNNYVDMVVCGNYITKDDNYIEKINSILLEK